MEDRGDDRKSDIRVYSRITREDHAPTYYRIAVPAKALRDEGLADSRIYSATAKPASDDYEYHIWSKLEEEANESAAWANVIRVLYGTSEALLQNLKRVRANSIFHDRVPPVYIMDCDDLVEWVSPMNRAFWYFGTRDFQEQPLTEDSKLEFAGVDLIARAPAHGGFSLENNKRRVGQIYEIALNCDGVSCTRQEMADYYHNDVGVEDVYVLPNAIDLEHIPQFRVQREDDDPVRILWQGGDSHLLDLLAISEPLLQIVKEEHAKLVICGTELGRFKNELPPEKYEWHQWIPFQAHYHGLAERDADINLCPLIDSKFNRCKSAIKFYEPSCLLKPPATIATNVGPYQEIIDGDTGMLAENTDDFATKLRALIRDADLRKRLGASARQWVHTYRSSGVVAHDYAKWLEYMIEKKERNHAKRRSTYKLSEGVTVSLGA